MECTENRGTSPKASPCAFLPCHLLAVVFSGLLKCCYNLKIPLFTCKIPLFTCKRPWCHQQLPGLLCSWAHSNGVELLSASICLCTWLRLWLHVHSSEWGSEQSESQPGTRFLLSNRSVPRAWALPQFEWDGARHQVKERHVQHRGKRERKP